MAEFKYEINDAVATLSQSGDYTCEVNVITYGTGRPKLDIRKWNRAEDKMQKGITLDKPCLRRCRISISKNSVNHQFHRRQAAGMPFFFWFDND